MASKLGVSQPKCLLKDATLKEISECLECIRKENPLYEGVVATYENSDGTRKMFKVKTSWYHDLHKHMVMNRGTDLTHRRHCHPTSLCRILGKGNSRAKAQQG